MSYGYAQVAPLPRVSKIEEMPFGSNLAIDRAINWVERTLFDMMPDVNFWVAGGSIRSILSNSSQLDPSKGILDEVDDFDLYFSSESDFNKAVAALSAFKGANYVMKTPFSVKYIVPITNFGPITIDLVSVVHESAKACIESFDFTVCCAAIEHGVLLHHKDYFTDLATKTLAINEVNNPVAALRRMQKYAKKGFTATNFTMKTIAMDIASLSPDDACFNSEEDYA